MQSPLQLTAGHRFPSQSLGHSEQLLAKCDPQFAPKIIDVLVVYFDLKSILL